MLHGDRPGRWCFLAIPHSPDFRRVREAVEDGVRKARFRTASLDDELYLPGVVEERVVGEIARADCVFADLSDRSRTIAFEVGVAQAMGKGVFLLIQKGYPGSIPRAFRGREYLEYEPTEKGLSILSGDVAKLLHRYLRSPRRARLTPGIRFGAPFFVDWERLDRSAAENLCRELLSQMGYRRVDWYKESPEFDLIAELPKKDPDGFEYSELWLVAMGRNAPPEMILDMMVHEPEFARYVLSRGHKRDVRSLGEEEANAPITVLIILLGDDYSVGRIREMRERMQLKITKRRYPSNLRVRIWDRNYLTSLVQEFPQIGYKYFSDEARSRSKYRKTPDELYQENVQLGERLATTVANLKAEKDKRIRAERDAVWKDISFSAAHKIGNPIFAIETYLDPLEKRVAEKRVAEAKKVIVSVRGSVEKAKAIVDQFKSLTKAQEVNPVPTRLMPIIEDACEIVRNQGIVCEIVGDTEILVEGDPDRLAECFDELASNATHWLDKPEKRVFVEVTKPTRSRLPDFVDSRRLYALIHFKDSGAGVPLDNKNKIFDAFFTTHDQGTGLGLALVRRIVEGHGGAIVESGRPGQGADFEIYLPRVSARSAKRVMAKEITGKGREAPTKKVASKKAKRKAKKG